MSTVNAFVRIIDTTTDTKRRQAAKLFVFELGVGVLLTTIKALIHLSITSRLILPPSCISHMYFSLYIQLLPIVWWPNSSPILNQAAAWR